MTEHRTKADTRWLRRLALWAGVLLILGAAGCAVFRHYLAVYEKTLPEKAMEEIMLRMTKADWHRALRETCVGVSRYEDKNRVFNDWFDRTVNDAGLTWRKSLRGTEGQENVYSIYAGAVRIGTVRLVPDTARGPAGFRRFHWRPESITSVPISDLLQSVRVEIDAPPDCEILLNGRRLSRQEITDDAVPIPAVTPLEARFTERMALSRFVSPPLYGQIRVTDGEGRPLAADGPVTDGVCRFTVLPAKTRSFLVEAPEDVEVTVCGAPMTEAELVSRDDRLFRMLERFAGEDAYAVCRYAAGELYTAPEIRGTYRGQTLTPVAGSDGCLHFFHPDDPAATEEMRRAAEDFFGAYLGYLSSRFNTAAYQKLMGLLLPGSELDAYVRNSMAAMIWASATEMSDASLQFGNFHIVGDDCFTCTIRYSADFTSDNWYEQYSYERTDGYSMAFVRRNGVWKAAAMSAFAA